MGVAVKVTGFPEQNGLDDAAMETDTGRAGLTVKVIMFDMAGLLAMHRVFEEVTMQDTWSPDAGVYINIALFVPVIPPFTFH